ncbi:MAG: hypothetical protein DRJ62_01505 [Thermoprotei archaeon]|nr:MAG: hypothetical protein DRJ62_01505 [Thermoprotei archaeon]
MYLKWLFSTSLMYGIDGPYYLLQVKNILATGFMKYPDPPLLFYVMALVSYAAGDVVVGVKVTIAVFVALAGVPMALLVSRVTGSKIGTIASYAVFSYSPFLFRLVGDLIKNACGLLFTLFCLYFLARSMSKPSFKDSLISSAFLLLTGLTHILDFLVALALAVLSPLVMFVSRRLRGERVNFKPFTPIYASTALVVLLGCLTPAMGGDMGKVLAFLQSLGSAHPLEQLPPWTPLSLSFLVIGAILTLELLAKEASRSITYIATPLLVLTVAFNAYPIIPHDFMWRLSLMNIIPAAFYSGVLVARVEAGSSVTALSVAVLVVMLVSFGGLRASQSLMPTITPEEAEEISQVDDMLPSQVCVVAPKTPLRYWAEFLMDRPVYDRADRAFERGFSEVVIMVEKGDRHPLTTPIYVGRWIEVYPAPRRLKALSLELTLK